MIRDANTNDAEVIAEIYNYYIENSVVTFEQEPIEAVEIIARMQKVWSAGYAWLVAEEKGQILGYAYSSRWQQRAAFQNSSEVTVYLSNSSHGQGWGTKLYSELFNRLRAGSTHMAIAGITLPNEESVALHEKFGMQKVAHFKQVGFKFDEWLDVGYWQTQIK